MKWPHNLGMCVVKDAEVYLEGQSCRIQDSYKESLDYSHSQNVTVSSSSMTATLCGSIVFWKWTVLELAYKLHTFEPTPITKKTDYPVFLLCVAFT